MKKIFIPLATCAIISLVTGFLIGWCFESFLNRSKKGHRSLVFYNGHNLGREITKEEKMLISRMEVQNQNLIKDLSSKEQEILNKIILDVKEFHRSESDSSRPKQFSPSERKLIQKIKAYRKNHQTAVDRKMLRSALSKMTVDQIIDLYLGVK